MPYPADLWQTIGVSAVVSGLVTAAYQTWSDRRALKFRLATEQHHAELTDLRKLMQRYYGGLLEGALEWHSQMEDLYAGAWRWLDPPDDRRHEPEEYVYQGLVFRFLSLLGVARRLETEAYYIHPYLARDQEFDPVRYAKAFLWVMTDPTLTPNDGVPGIDHFHGQSLRLVLDSCYAQDERLPETRSPDGQLVFEWRRYGALLRSDDDDLRPGLESVLAFFDGVRPEGDYGHDGSARQRWDRIILLHVLAIAFINRFGFPWQHVDASAAMRASDALAHERPARAFLTQLGSTGLRDDDEMKRVCAALTTAGRNGPERGPQQSSPWE